MISDETVERVRSAADIVQIIGEYVPLRRSGADYRGACPFHGGSKPNFTVSQKRGSYHCFVCQESGDVFTFVRKRLGLDFPGAIKLIGERVGIEVVDTPSRLSAPDPNERNWEVLSTATEWYRAQLVHEAIGRDARQYLDGRGIDESTCARFAVGFAPRDAQSLRRYLHGLGFDDARLVEAGLLVLRDGETEPRQRFFGRIMFPIVDELGHHIAFGGRAIGDDTPKYLNSGESAVFQKRATLYGLYAAKNAMRRNSRAIVVEGYLDVIRLAVAGIEEVVAPLGTALTEEQAELLVRYAREIFLLYDSDEAGQKATFRSGKELLRHRATVRVVSLPTGEDPDSFVRAHGRNGLEVLLAQAIDVFDRQLQVLERLGWFSNLRKLRLAIDKLLPTIRAARDPLTRELYLARLADVSHLEKATLASEADEPPASSRALRRGGSDDEGDPGPIDATPAAHRVTDENNPASPPSPYAGSQARKEWKGRRGRPVGPEWQATSVPPRPRKDEPVERTLLRAMLIDRSLVERVAERHGPDAFRDARYRAVFHALLSAGHEADLDAIAEHLDPQPLQALQDLTNTAKGDATEAALDVSMSLARLDARPLETRSDDIMAEMSRASPARQIELTKELMELGRELRRLLPIRSPRAKPKG